MGRDTWLAIEIIRSGSDAKWKLEITTDEMTTITWPVTFETPSKAVEVAEQTIDQIGATNLYLFARPVSPINR
ncbi:hypothetical protein [Sulfitobacter geojensis]|uniref:hypothetical protein n=1 Tax=Sulfitobacter geojensis TaxID=1342299 RepID=UPI003B8AF204